jgi:anthranilate/para-aminobenzoate synthase component I
VLNNKEYLNRLYQSDKPLIIYKTDKGYDIYTDFSRRIIINKKNLKYFLNIQSKSKKSKIEELNCYVGFFGYKLLCENIGIKFPKQRSKNFHSGVFYKPQTKISIGKKIIIKSIKPNFRNISINTKKYLQLNKKFNLNLSLKQYSKIFNDFSKNIKQGKTYQIKIAQTYSKKGNINSIDLFWKLMKMNESPESFLIREKDYNIVSCSPETLILKKNNTIRTKPIAGTLRKTKKLNKNKALTFFRRNEKETKEHNMIVDMERNDLSKICKTGSVKIDKLKKVEEYRDLFHYVTTIKGVIKNKMSNHDIISSLMPGGSVIGCPKISTIQLLNRKEKFDRNIYTGSFGIIHSNGDMRFNIMIRTLLNFKNDIELSVASGVILGSTAKKEYNENYIKAKSLLDLFN